MIVLAAKRGALCLSCADLDHLAFLPPGDAALTLRARKYSTRVAVVVKWSHAEAVRAPRTPGRGRCASARRGQVPERCGGAGAASRARGGTARRPGRCVRGAVRGTHSAALHGLPARSAGANCFACVPEVQRTHRTLGFR